MGSTRSRRRCIPAGLSTRWLQRWKGRCRQPAILAITHYRGDPEEQRILRHFSYSDRTRYYWASSPAQTQYGDSWNG